MADEKAKRDRAMTTVMNLLALAADPNASPAERELAAQNAENLMAKHMIDRLELKPEDRSKIVEDSWSISVGDDAEFTGIIRQLVLTLLRHNNIKFYPKLSWGKNEHGHTDYRVEIWKIVGFPEDIAYAEALWFRVFREFINNLNPEWDRNKSLGENAYNFMQAGVKWPKIWRMAYDNGAKIAEPGTVKYTPSTLKREVQKYMAANDLGEYSGHTQSHGKYRNSFAQSFAATIGVRLTKMRQAAQKETGDADRFALALRSTEDQVNDRYNELFPDAKGIWEAAAATAAGRRQRRGRIRVDDTFDSAAWSRGNAAAQKVNLRQDAEVKRNTRKELGA